VDMGERKRAWCYWSRMYYNDEVGSSEGNNLYILRLAIEEALEDTEDGEMAVAALLQAGQREASEWHMESVVVWNPSKLVRRAAARAMGRKGEEIEIVYREKESIAALRWYGDGAGTKEGKKLVEWVANEKFAWC